MIGHEYEGGWGGGGARKQFTHPRVSTSCVFPVGMINLLFKFANKSRIRITIYSEIRFLKLRIRIEYSTCYLKTASRFPQRTTTLVRALLRAVATLVVAKSSKADRNRYRLRHFIPCFELYDNLMVFTVRGTAVLS